MSIVRAARKSNYYMLPSSVIEDRRLSWAARGLLVYLLSKPDNWCVKMTDLLNQTRQAIGGRSGRDKVYKVINELRTAGYLYQEFIREGGGFRGVEYEVSEVPDLEQAAIYVASVQAKAYAKGKSGGDEPFTDLPETVTPRTESPVTAAPFTEKPETLDSTESATRIEKAVTYDDPGQAGESVGVEAALAARSKSHQPEGGEPANYPQTPTVPSYAPWHAYARAYRAKHKAWPVCNKHQLSLMCQLVARVGDLAALVATYYVKHESTQSIVTAMHPVSMLLKNCESYATRAQKSERVQAAREQAESKAQPAPVAPVEAEELDTTPEPAVTHDKSPGIGLAALLAMAAARMPAQDVTEGEEPAEVEPKAIPAGLLALRAARPGPQPVRFV